MSPFEVIAKGTFSILCKFATFSISSISVTSSKSIFLSVSIFSIDLQTGQFVEYNLAF